MNKRTLTAAMMIAYLATVSLAADDLAKNFATPPPPARPWVYWFPLDGNISSNGITADLEAMARVGIGGVLYMETDQGVPKGPARFGGPLWRDLFKRICNEAHRLGLQVNMNNDAGWCGSGGPWITPELSMQVIVWSETNVVGGARFNAALTQPKANRDFYRDIAVFAFPTPATNYVIPQIRSKSAAVRGEVALRTAFPTLRPDAVIVREQVRILPAKDGRVQWDMPPGNWTLLRMGHTTTGKENHPAPLEGRGLECDKLSKKAVEVHFNNLIGKLIADNKRHVGEKRTLVSTHIDSWEVGSQNWTPRFREEFRRLRGYDPLPLLPVMTGRVVDSLEVSERFLWDIRQTVNDLLCENYAGHLRTLAHRHGLRLSIEAYDTPPCDDLTYAGRADEPMSEFWSWTRDVPWAGHRYSSVEMASAAHVYGRPILGAEAFTATNEEKWQGHPANIKALGDWAFCQGVNRFVFHRYALQPWTNPDRPPGMSMGPWGLHYERTQTWWEMSKAWHEYLARCQYLLQQGLFVADLCFLVPERSPQRAKSPVKSGYERPGYNFDLCPAEVVLTRMTVKDGRIILPDGMSYRMLVLPQVETMTPKLLRKIRDLVKAGATVVGMPPKKSPSLQNYPRCDEEVQAMASQSWPASPGERAVGRGCVIWPPEMQKKPEAPYEEVTAFKSAKWIWFPEGKPARSAPPGTRHFRRAIYVSGEIASARLVMTADNTFECWINGRSAGKGAHFKQGYGMDIRPLLKPGTNSITVTAVNTLDYPNPAGLIGALSIKYRDGRTQDVCTDASWEAAQSQTGEWKAALELGPWGMAPWGEVEEAPEEVDEIPDIAIPSRLLAKMGVPPDFKSSANIRYIHKRIDETDVYFIANPEPNEVEAVCEFRVTGKEPELWWPDTGRIQAVACEQKDGCTRIALRFDPSGSVFVVFRRSSRVAPRDGETQKLLTRSLRTTLLGPWKVTFDPKWGGPAKPVTFETLQDWSQRPENGIRYYSGKATYSCQFEIPDLQSAILLDLGRVEVMARVRVNGRDCGIAWKPPYRVDISHAVRAGKNNLEIEVVNLWINRLIGDEQLPEDSDRNPNGTLKSWPSWLAEGRPSPSGRFTFTTHRLWKKDDPLAPSGLLGPVQLVSAPLPP